MVALSGSRIDFVIQIKVGEPYSDLISKVNLLLAWPINLCRNLLLKLIQLRSKGSKGREANSVLFVFGRCRRSTFLWVCRAQRVTIAIGGRTVGRTGSQIGFRNRQKERRRVRSWFTRLFLYLFERNFQRGRQWDLKVKLGNLCL